MKQATKAFPLDNGTVYEGQELPDSHPAVIRYPDNFTDVEIPGAVGEGQVGAEGSTVPHGLTTDGVGQVKVVDEPPATTNPDDQAGAADPSASTSAPTS